MMKSDCPTANCYLRDMFVRRKQNKSGTTSIQAIAKADGKYRLQKSFGSSRDESVLSSLERILKSAGSKISLDRARFLAEKIYHIDYVNPYDKKSKSVLLHTKEQPEVTELGITEKDIPALAEQAIADVCTPGNPRDVTETEIIELYKKVL